VCFGSSVPTCSPPSPAGLVNVLMLVAAAASFFAAGLTHVDTLAGDLNAFRVTIGGAAALTFALAVLVSGLASSTVGSMPARWSCRASPSPNFRSRSAGS
jgi:Mn2+/Fe2+ NRAMP family transporter